MPVFPFPLVFPLEIVFSPALGMTGTLGSGMGGKYTALGTRSTVKSGRDSNYCTALGMRSSVERGKYNSSTALEVRSTVKSREARG